MGLVKTSQELRMLSTVTLYCQVTKIFINSASQLSQLQSVSQMSQVSRSILGHNCERPLIPLMDFFGFFCARSKIRAGPVKKPPFRCVFLQKMGSILSLKKNKRGVGLVKGILFPMFLHLFPSRKHDL